MTTKLRLSFGMIDLISRGMSNREIANEPRSLNLRD